MCIKMYRTFGLYHQMKLKKNEYLFILNEAFKKKTAMKSLI